MNEYATAFLNNFHCAILKKKINLVTHKRHSGWEKAGLEDVMFN